MSFPQLTTAKTAALAMAEQSCSIDALNLSGHLRERILCRVPPPTSGTGENVVDTSPQIKGDNKNDKGDDASSPALSSFVLYLPTVVLRAKHNPAFALACSLANRHGVPLLVLATVLDDTHLEQQQQQQQQPQQHNKNGNANANAPVVATARRLAFTLEALQECCKAWESHGAGVAIRVHGPGCRSPHHLSLAHSGAALAVVSDEPFVEPYRTYVRRIARACRSVVGRVPFYTADGSTSVPPNSRLVRMQKTSGDCNGVASSLEGDDVWFSGAPSKAWRWEKQTESVRKQHVYGACREKELEAPDLLCRLPPDWFVEGNSSSSGTIDVDVVRLRQLRQRMPSKWTDRGAPSPGQRPWTVSEFSAIDDCKSWASAWHGADSSVPPCQQTHGSRTSAKRRWRAFVESGRLKDYAKKRNGITNPHVVSRISCYLNLGILSIFEVIRDVWQAQSIRGNTTGCAKFLEEVVKWREGSYVHAFANPNYHSVDVLPAWAIRCMESKSNNSNRSYTYQQLESASTRDETWNAMQDYLIDTGELHNNARMTWGKTVVHWQAGSLPPEEILRQLCLLNDRFALDGLSPPSYGGILWCFGWQDKPAAGKGGGVSEKWAHRYRTGPDGFQRAKDLLLMSFPSPATERIHLRTGGAAKRSTFAFVSASASDQNHTTGSPDQLSKRARVSPAKSSNSKTILSYFGPTAAKSRRSSG